jgi:heme oxygenase
MAHETDTRQQGIRWYLRDATKDLHEDVDGLGSSFSLSDAAGYRRFLRAHARALPGLEQAIETAGIAALVPDWPQRSRRAALAADLASLGEALPAAATAYLGHKARWPAFLERLEAGLADPASWPLAAEGARAAFHHFHAALAAEAQEGRLLNA